MKKKISVLDKMLTLVLSNIRKLNGVLSTILPYILQTMVCMQSTTMLDIVHIFLSKIQ